jgi:putative peptidoglycan lipid II flippase
MNLMKAALAVSGMTLLSRLTGLLREMLMARLLGAGLTTDAFFIAFRIPNLLRRLFAEGAFSQAFVPILASTRAARGDEATKDLIAKTATLLFWLLFVVSLAGVIGAPGLVWLMAGGLDTGHPDRLALTVQLTRWMFPYIGFISLVALASGILNTYRHFSLPAFTPVLLNVSFIGAIVLVAPRLSQPVYALAGAVMVGGLLQLAIQIPALKRLGLLPRIGLTRSALRDAWSDLVVRRIVRQMLPATLAVSVAQLSLIINTNIASHLGAGSVSWISFGDRLMEFPTAMLGVALGTVLLPALSKASMSDTPDEFAGLLDWGLRLVLLLALPAAIGLATLAEPLTALLFHYGRFSSTDVVMTGQAVLAYSIGLTGLVALKVLAPAFYAHQDIRTPVKVALVVLVLTQLLNLLCVPLFGHAGLPLAIGLGASANAVLLLIGLIRRKLYRPQPGWLRFSFAIAFANGLMAVFLLKLAPWIDWQALQKTPFLRLLESLGLIVLAGLLYFGCMRLMGYPLHSLLKRRV